jgi:hypothetical protein
MTREVELYTQYETFEEKLARVYRDLHDRFIDNAELAQFWLDMSYEELRHAAVLRLCREQGCFTPDRIDSSAAERIEGLVRTVTSVANSPDLTIPEAFYASLLVEASELDDVYSHLIRGLVPESREAYNAVHDNLATHHEKFAVAAEKFLHDPAFVAAFRNLAKRDSPARNPSDRR